MFLDLIGIVEDAARGRAAPPDNPRTVMRLQRGGTVTVRLRVLTRSGVPVFFDVTGGDTAVLAIRKRPQDPALLSVAGVAVPEDAINRIDFAFGTSLDWSNLEPIGRGATLVYDVKLTRAGGAVIDFVVPLSTLIVEPT